MAGKMNISNRYKIIQTNIATTERTAMCPKAMGIWSFFSVLPLAYSHRGVSVPSVESGSAIQVKVSRMIIHELFRINIRV